MHEISPDKEWRRRYELYHGMSDDELLGLKSEFDDLTDLARDVLKRKLNTRKLSLPDAGEAAATPKRRESGSDEVDSGSLVSLMTFFDAIDCGRACELLEEDGVAFQSRDRSVAGSGPRIALELLVHDADLDRAKMILREGMGLFRQQEMRASDRLFDENAIGTLGRQFGRIEETKDIVRVLEGAGYWHRVVTNLEGTVESQDRYRVEVKEKDLVEAVQVG